MIIKYIIFTILCILSAFILVMLPFALISTPNVIVKNIWDIIFPLFGVASLLGYFLIKFWKCLH